MKSTLLKSSKQLAAQATSKKSASAHFAPYTEIDFPSVEKRAQLFADLIEEKRAHIENILLAYESYEVVRDEMERTLDLLRNLSENKSYFRARVRSVTAFLPRNQPLYAFSCFVIVPSLMASEVHFRIPSSMREFFPHLLIALETKKRFPNIQWSSLTRLEFLRDRSSLRVDPETEETLPVTDVVIFTGTPQHAEQLQKIFDESVLFISNGSGHNPVIVSSNADIDAAVETTLTLQLYNQGQDCAAPNAILVHARIFDSFRSALIEGIRSVKVGAYRDRACRVGPISDPEDLVRIEDFLIHHRAWIDPATPGIIRAHEAIVEPTIISKPLSEDGNYTEIFAPVMVLQKYEKDADLALYFENPRYAQNAMYVTVYGTSRYVSQLMGRRLEGTILHNKSTILFNTHLHVKGVERGVKPYGGYGFGASHVSIRGRTTAKPTLAQRDIYEYLIRPIMKRETLAMHRKNLERFTVVTPKNLEKIMRLTSHDASQTREQQASGNTYVDLHAISSKARYAHVDERHTYHLLKYPNATHIAQLSPSEVKAVRGLILLLRKKRQSDLEEFKTEIYALAALPGAVAEVNRVRQRDFFEHVYQLLFGKPTGPKLAQFLMDADVHAVTHLLDV